MIKEFEIFVASLNGFLYAVQKLTENRVILSNGHFKLVGNVESSLKKYLQGWDDDPKIISCNIISYSSFETLLSKKIYSKIEANKNIISSLDWQLQEYFGLISTSIDSDGAFHPLVNGPIYITTVRTNQSLITYILTVKIGDNGFFIAIRNNEA